MKFEDIKLFPHNQETYDKIQEQWKISNKVATVQATGTGKTYLILKCLYNLIDENKIVLAPSNYILEQTEREAGETIPNTMMMTYADLAINTEEKIQNINPSLIVLDEFHRCGAEQWGNGIQKLLDKFTNAKILGTSATNIRFLDNNRDMADELFNGNIVTNLSLPQAIIKGILPMPKYISALYTFENETNKLKEKINNSKNTNEEKKELLKEIEFLKNKLNKSKGIDKILRKHLTKNSNDKFVIFCKDKNHLNEMKEVIVDWFKKAKITKKIDVYEVYSEYINSDIDVMNFKNNQSEDTIKLLFSIDMFNEGIHIKDVTGVILLRPTTSPIIYYQQIGRAIQAGNANNPIIFDFVNNFNNIGAKKFISDLKQSFKQEQTDENINNNKIFNCEDEFIIYDEMQEAKEMFINIEDRLFDNWEKMYEELKKYYLKYGHIEIKQNINLSAWVYNQRDHGKKGLLIKDKINKLNNIGFSWNFIEDNWDNMYMKLKDYYIINGNCFVTPTDNKQLCAWVRNQRSSLGTDRMTLEKKQKLDDINFEWNNVNDSKWQLYYNQLEEYYIKYRNCDVELIKANDFKKLIKWVSTQRETYKKGNLSLDKIEALEKLQFIWNKKDNKWNKMYQYLINYKNNNGNLNVPYNFSPQKGMNLSSWIKQQKKIYKENRLPQEKINKLNEIGFIWD